MKKIQSKMKALVWPHFSHYKSMGIFPGAQGQLNPWLDLAKFRTHTSFMVVLITYKNEKHPIENEGARMATTVNINF